MTQPDSNTTGESPDDSFLFRDETRLPNGDKVNIVGGEIWVELTNPVTMPIENPPVDIPVKERFKIIDLPTDAVRVAVITTPPVTGNAPRIDYDKQEFRSKTTDGLLVPASVVESNNEERNPSQPTHLTRRL